MRQYKNRAETLNKRINVKGNFENENSLSNGSWHDKAILEGKADNDLFMAYGSSLEDRYGRKELWPHGHLDTRKAKREREIRNQKMKKELEARTVKENKK